MIADWATYKLVTGDTFSSQADAEAALARAQSKAEEITGRLFDKAERTETLPVDDRGKVWPSAYPIAAVSLPTGATITDDGLSILTSSNVWWQGLSTVLPLPGVLAERPRAAVTYTGGYDGTTPAPIGLVDAICELAHRYRNPADMSTVPAGATSLGASGQSVSGPRLGGSASVPPALRAAILKFQHISGRLP